MADPAIPEATDDFLPAPRPRTGARARPEARAGAWRSSRTESSESLGLGARHSSSDFRPRDSSVSSVSSVGADDFPPAPRPRTGARARPEARAGAWRSSRTESSESLGLGARHSSSASADFRPRDSSVSSVSSVGARLSKRASYNEAAAAESSTLSVSCMFWNKQIIS